MLDLHPFNANSTAIPHPDHDMSADIAKYHPGSGHSLLRSMNCDQPEMLHIPTDMCVCVCVCVCVCINRIFY